MKGRYRSAAREDRGGRDHHHAGAQSLNQRQMTRPRLQGLRRQKPATVAIIVIFRPLSPSDLGRPGQHQTHRARTRHCRLISAEAMMRVTVSALARWFAEWRAHALPSCGCRRTKAGRRWPCRCRRNAPAFRRGPAPGRKPSVLPIAEGLDPSSGRRCTRSNSCPLQPRQGWAPRRRGHLRSWAASIRRINWTPAGASGSRGWPAVRFDRVIPGLVALARNDARPGGYAASFCVFSNRTQASAQPLASSRTRAIQAWRVQPRKWRRGHQPD